MQQNKAPRRYVRRVGAVAATGVFASMLAIATAPSASAALPAPTVTNHGATGVNDGYNAVIPAPGGGTFQVGFQVVAGSDQAVLVTKAKADGSLDTAFGTGGRAVINLQPESGIHASIASNRGAKEKGTAVAVDSQGRILVLGELEGKQDSADTAADTDLFMARLTTAGALDTTYGTAGWTRISFGDGRAKQSTAENAPIVPGVVDYAGADIGLRADGKAVFTVGVGTDSSGTRAVRLLGTAQVTANGAVDTAFGTGGVVSFPLNFSLNVRRGFLDADGSWYAGAYANIGANNQPFISKVDASGKPDESWGSFQPGLTTFLAGGSGGFAEAYGIAKQTDGNIIVSGYGYPAGEGAAKGNSVDAILFAVAADGRLNKAWGKNGMVNYQIGADGNNSGDRHRGHQILPDGRIVGVGASGTTGNIDALVTLTSADGKSVGETKVIDLGGPGDVLWDIAATGDGYDIVAVGSSNAPGDTNAQIVKFRVTPLPPVVVPPVQSGKVASSVALQVSKAKIKKGKKSEITVTVTGGSAPATGLVTVYVGKKKVVDGYLAGGSVTMQLPKVKGKKAIRVSYSGDATLNASEASVKVKAKK